MYALPDVDEVVAVAKELGIHLGPDEAVMYRKYLMEQMEQLDTFVQARLDEPKPPMVSAARKPGSTLGCGNVGLRGRPKAYSPERLSVTKTTSLWQASP